MKKRYSSIFNLISFIINGFKKVFDFSVLKKILLVGFFLSAMFIMYAVSTVCGTLNITDKDFIEYNRNYLQIKQPNMKVADYLNYEQNENNIYILPGNSKVTFSLQVKDYYQISQIQNDIKGSLASTKIVSANQLVVGRMPQNVNEVLIDKSIIQDNIDTEFSTLKMCGITKVEDVLNRELIINNMKPFVIVGLVDDGNPSIYVDESMFINIIANSSSDEAEYGMINSGGLEQPQSGTLMDYRLFEDKIELKKGKLPENDYEIIVNNSNSEQIPLNKTINVMVNDTKLTVVGYYESQEEINYYFTNNNTIKYKLITDKDEFTIYPKTKDETLKFFRGLNLNIEDTYEKSKTKYMNSQKESIKASLIVSGIILGISLIEIFLMIRSSFLSRIKEIGILRAIGVKRQDIYKMFIGEIIAITTLASVPGIALMTYILKVLSTIKYLASYFVVNTFAVGATILFVYLFNLIVGLLPVYKVIRKTPAQILSRNDI